mmetsp:Transcript_9433/g.35316  ORF Transcript_9433/g.35316 Transcript_9433/m.35316 type:complete len:285 (+) Transcript_9433:576-1430(+)
MHGFVAGIQNLSIVVEVVAHLPKAADEPLVQAVLADSLDPQAHRGRQSGESWLASGRVGRAGHVRGHAGYRVHGRVPREHGAVGLHGREVCHQLGTAGIVQACRSVELSVQQRRPRAHGGGERVLLQPRHENARGVRRGAPRPKPVHHQRAVVGLARSKVGELPSEILQLKAMSLQVQDAHVGSDQAVRQAKQALQHVPGRSIGLVQRAQHPLQVVKLPPAAAQGDSRAGADLIKLLAQSRGQLLAQKVRHKCVVQAVVLLDQPQLQILGDAEEQLRAQALRTA